MRFFIRIILVIMSVIILPCSLAPNTMAATKIEVRATAAVNVRTGPGTNFTVLGEIEENEVLQKLGDTGAWTKVAYRGNTGYVFSKYLEIIYAYNDWKPVDLVVTIREMTLQNRGIQSASGETIYGKSEKGAIYHRIAVENGWSYIRGTKELSEFDHAVGWIESGDVLPLTAVDSNQHDSYPNAYLNKNIKLVLLPKGKSKGNTLYKGTKIREWGRYLDWSYVSIWADGISYSGFVRTKHLSDKPIYSSSSGKIYYTTIDNPSLFIGPGNRYPTINNDGQSYPYSADYKEKGSAVTVIEPIGSWYKIVMRDGSIAFVGKTDLNK